MVGVREDGEGAACRWRERRLRSWLKHERQSAALALSECTHHSSRGQRKDRAGEEGHRDKYEAPRRQKPKHTMEQLADVVPMVQILDIPVPQMVEQLLEVFRLLDTQMLVEQAIALRKICRALCGPCSADGGTVGGSTNDRVLLFPAQCRADRRHPCSAWSWSSSSRFSPRTGFSSVRLRANR